MNDTERSLETIARLHAEIIRERAESLREAARAAGARLAKREEELARLRAQAAALKASLRAAQAAPLPVPEKEAAMDSARFATASLPRTASWRSLAPYAAIVACAVLLDLGGSRRREPAAPNLAVLAQPAPSVVANASPAAKGAPVMDDDDRSQEALLLVHEWKLPGDEKTLGERLGGMLDLPGGRPSWSVERTGAHGYHVTFQPGEKDLPYAFEADIEARVVWPTPETQELLAPRFTAAFRDPAR
ncbi:MAG: hypothetical protein HY403_11245 [Elusimicrobia bacterium]|nr:hypothetical protein [Elusimicrobiota bacterium]